jgi:DNA invertase Pin-like site-specific DNA recombinase
MLIGYARVSTEDQNLNLQRDALKKHGVERAQIYEEHISGATRNRPELMACLRALREHFGGEVGRCPSIGQT